VNKEPRRKVLVMDVFAQIFGNALKLLIYYYSQFFMELVVAVVEVRCIEYGGVKVVKYGKSGTGEQR
jgi:hypothetical protein